MKILLASTLLLISGVACAQNQPAPQSTPEKSGCPNCLSKDFVGQLAPDFELPTLDKGKLKLSDLRGKAVLLSFWATWCEPCKIEMPWFVELQNEYGPQGFQVVGVSLDEDASLLDISGYARGMNVNYPIVVGDSSWFEKRYGGTIFLPTTLFLDREGKVIAREIGVQSHNVYVEHIKKSLDADPVVREQRRLEQQKLKGITSQSVTTEIRERDLRDRTRAASPLVPAADALILDSTALSEDEVLRRVEEAVQKKTDALR